MPQLHLPPPQRQTVGVGQMWGAAIEITFDLIYETACRPSMWVGTASFEAGCFELAFSSRRVASVQTASVEVASVPPSSVGAAFLDAASAQPVPIFLLLCPGFPRSELQHIMGRVLLPVAPGWTA